MNKITQAIILAAGESSRFIPYSKNAHKSTLSLLGKPIIVHTLFSIQRAGISDILIITGKGNSIKEIVQKEQIQNLKITFVTQENPEGMGAALLKAKENIHPEFYLLHAHHVDFDLQKSLLEKKYSEAGLVLLAKEEKDLQRFGVLQVESDRVTGLIEKPAKGTEPSNLRVVGIYQLNKEFIKVLEETPTDHYHFEKALDAIAQKQTVKIAVTQETVSLKYPWDIFSIKNFLMRNLQRSISPWAKISDSSQIIGNVYVDDGAQIGENAILKGPCYVGKNVFIGTNALLRNGADVEENSVVGAFMEIKNSIILPGTTTHAGFIGDSIIGSGCKIAGSFCTGNVRLDRQEISAEIKGEKINSGYNSLGIFMGNNVNVGIHVSTMPGKIIGNNTIIGPSTTIMKNVPDNVRYYTQFKEIVEEQNVEQSLSTESFFQKTETNYKQKVVLFDIDYTLFDTGTFKESQLQKYSLYQETVDVILKLQGSAKLGIFSEGEIEFQKNKLLKTEINRHFENEYLHIVEKKDEVLESVLDKYDDYNLFLVDDKLPILHAAKKYKPSLFTIWIKRGIFADNQEPIKGFIPDAIVDTLDGIVSLVKNF